MNTTPKIAPPSRQVRDEMKGYRWRSRRRDANSDLQQTPLLSRHEELGARLIPFAGWIMPVQYTGVINEHRTVRNAAGLFDLGHMGQVEVTGNDALPFLQSVTTNDVTTLQPGDAQYSLLPNPTGGVIDDIIVYRLPDEPGYFVVINAAKIENVMSPGCTAAARFGQIWT